MHFKLGDEAERSSSPCFWRFQPEKILKLKKKGAFHNRVSCNKKPMHCERIQHSLLESRILSFFISSRTSSRPNIRPDEGLTLETSAF